MDTRDCVTDFEPVYEVRAYANGRLYAKVKVVANSRAQAEIYARDKVDEKWYGAHLLDYKAKRLNEDVLVRR